jgi:hypothetical protein
MALNDLQGGTFWYVLVRSGTFLHGIATIRDGKQSVSIGLMYPDTLP